MHELSIAMSIVEICTDELEKSGASSLTGVELEIGSLAGIQTEALEFSWDVATKDSVADGAVLSIDNVPAEARCLHCNKEFGIENFHDPCPYCNNFGLDVLKGKELRIKALTVE